MEVKDKVTVRVLVEEADGTVRDNTFEGESCLVSVGDEEAATGLIFGGVKDTLESIVAILKGMTDRLDLNAEESAEFMEMVTKQVVASKNFDVLTMIKEVLGRLE
jgi:NifU-like protein involved in Fe-S cluster formation